MIDKFQKAAIKSEAGIPYFYGNDQVHGVYDCKGAVVFPHNIGMGAADDEDLTYRVGRAVADEAMVCHELWCYAPVVAQSADLRWDSIVICYLPGSEAQGITDALCGGAEFTGKLPSPWYSSVNQIGTDKAWLEAGWGLKAN